MQTQHANKSNSAWQRDRESGFLRVVTTAGDIAMVPLSQIGGIVFDPDGSQATVYLAFEIPTQGNNTLPVQFDVTTEDAQALLASLEPEWRFGITAIP